MLVLAAMGCHAQPPAKAFGDASPAISPELSRRIEVAIRSRSDVPANYEFHIQSLTKSDMPGYDTVTVDFTVEGKSSRPIPFLL
jgi:hypothetical protein